MTAVRSMMVNVGANVGPYVAGMNTAGASTARFGTQAAGARTAAAGLGTTAIGSAARFLGPAGLVIGLTKSMGASRNFAESTIDLRTQIGLTTTQSEALAGAARQVGTDFGVGAQTAVDASWQIASAGLRGADATEALESAARAAAVGFGEMDTIAGLSAAAVNAYGSEVLGASEATDIMAAAVREGTAAPEELASSLGRALPVASAMSVSFDELSAAVAGMTRTGTSAPEAVTQIRSMLLGILNPAEGAAKAMAEVGLSSEGLQRTIQEEGLLAAMQQLAEATGMNNAQLSEIFPNIRAFQGFLDLMGPNAADNAAIFERMADSVGMVGEAFEEVEKSSTQFQIDRLKANISDLALETLGLNNITREYLRSLNEVMEVGIVRSTFTPPDMGRHVREGGIVREWFTGDVFGQNAPNQNLEGHLAAMRAQADQYVSGLERAAQAAANARGPQSQFADAVQLVADASERAGEALSGYLDEVRAATDPMFALRQAVQNVDEAQQAYTDAVAEHGETSAEARAASWELFEALTELERAALDGELSFADFERELQRFVDMGLISQEVANGIRDDVAELNSEVRLFEGEYLATLVADDQASTVVDALIDRLGRVQGTWAARLTLQGEAYTSGRSTFVPGTTSAPSRNTSTSMVTTRAGGGPFWDGMTALVGEDGPELLQFAGSGRVVPANQTQQMLRGGDGASQTTLNVYGNPDPRTMFRARDMWEAV